MSWYPGKLLEDFLKRRQEEKEEAARAAVSLMEVDGWKGRIDDATNHHKFRGKDDRDGVEGSLFSVLFTRFVDINHA